MNHSSKQSDINSKFGNDFDLGFERAETDSSLELPYASGLVPQGIEPASIDIASILNLEVTLPEAISGLFGDLELKGAIPQDNSHEPVIPSPIEEPSHSIATPSDSINFNSMGLPVNTLENLADPLPNSTTPLQKSVEEPSLEALADQTPSETSPGNHPSLQATNPGVPLSYGVVAKISMTRPTFGFQVEHELPIGVKLLKTEPTAEVVDRHLTWNFGNLQAGQEFRLKVVILPDPNAKLSPSDYTTFNASYTQKMQFESPVVRPQLKLEMKTPLVLGVGESAKAQIDLTNEGNWPVEKLKMTIQLSEGLLHRKGRTLHFDLNRIGPSELKKMTLDIQAMHSGDCSIFVIVTGDGYQKLEREFKGKVTQAKLKLNIQHPDHALVREMVPFRIQIQNIGNACTETIDIRVKLPAELELLSAQDGKIDPSQKEVQWELEPLPPDTVGNLFIQVRPQIPGKAKLQIDASSQELVESSERMIDVGLDPNQSGQLIDRFLMALEESSRSRTLRSEDSTIESSDSSRNETISHLIFSLVKTDYAIPLVNILEVSRLSQYTRLPNVPDWLIGITSLRGDILSVVDLRRFLGYESLDSSANQRLLVVRSLKQNLTIGLIVDQVKKIQPLDPSQILDVPSNLQDPVAPYISSLYEAANKLIVIFDLELLFANSGLNRFSDSPVSEFAP